MENNTVLAAPIENMPDRITNDRSIAQIPAAPPRVSLATLTMNEMVESVELIKNAMKRVMEEGVDYGKVPGTDKPTLLKPGAEKLCVLFRLATQYDVTIQEFDGGHREYRVITTLIHINTGQIIGQGVGSCSTLEGKYRYRNAARKCPQCGKEAIIKGKADYGGGWLCFKKKDGCGAKFAETDPAIVGQEAGKVENPDIADSYNTVFKMAKKRSLIDATLTATAASAIFTQDVEEIQVDRDGSQRDQSQRNQRNAPATQPNGQSTQSRPQPNAPPQASRSNGNGPDVPRHMTDSGAGAFQQSYVIPLKQERMTELCDHFAINVEKRYTEYVDRNQVKRQGREYHVAGISEPLKDCIPQYILDACTRTKDQPYDKYRGLWIRQGVIAFNTLEGIGTFFVKLDEYERTVLDRKPSNPPPMMAQAPEMLPQYQDQDDPF